MLSRLAKAVASYPKWFIYPQIILSVVCVLYAAYGLKLDTNRDNLVGPGKKYHEIYLNFRKEFPQEDQLVLVEGEKPEQNRQFIERLAARLKPETNLFAHIFYKGDLATLGPKGLMLAPVEDLEKMQNSIREYLPFLKKFSHTTNLESLFGMVNEQFLTANTQPRGQREDLLKTLPFFQNVLADATWGVTEPGPPPPPEIGALLGGGSKQDQAYLTFDDGKIFLLTFRPINEDAAGRAIDRLRKMISETENEVPGVNAALTGGLVLNHDEMRQSERDSIIAGIAALIICSLIFIVAYRQVIWPLKAAFCLLIGFGYTLGFTTLVIGHLNILSITFAPILVGLAIDYGVQFISRYEEEMRRNGNPLEASHKAIVFTGQGIVVTGMTTAAAFLAMGLTHFKGIREMGIICGGGLLFCLIPMMTVLPALLIIESPRPLRQAPVAGQRRLLIQRSWLQHAGAIVAVTLVLCLIAARYVNDVSFDYNLLHLQSKNLPSVVYANKLLHSAGRSVMFGAVVADSPQEAMEYEERLKKLPTVASVSSAAGYFTEDQEKKLGIIRALKQDLADVHFAPIDQKPVQIDKLSAMVWYLSGYLGLATQATQKKDPDLTAQLHSLRKAIDDFRKAILSKEPQVPEQLQLYQQALFQEIHRTMAAIKNQDVSSHLTEATLPAVIRDRFIGVNGKYLLQVYPKKDIWNHENQREFIQQLQSAVPPDKVTGTPLQIYQYTTLLKQSYQQAAWYSLAAITIMLFLHFRSPAWVVLALLPVGIGLLWLLGFMGAMGISFNPANIMILPLVIGIGVTNGIQILNRVAEEHEPGVLAKSTGKAVLVTGLTSLTGFGTLLLARHQGIRSLGEIMPLGIAACMIAGLTFLPALLRLLSRGGWAVGSVEEPEHFGSLWQWLRSHRH